MKDKSPAWQRHRHCCPQAAAASAPLKQSNTVVKNLVQRKALNEPTLAPLYIQLCWAGYKMLLSWQISHGHCGSKDQSQPLRAGADLASSDTQTHNNPHHLCSILQYHPLVQTPTHGQHKRAAPSTIVEMFTCSGLRGWENPQATKLHLVTTGYHRFICGWAQLRENKMLKARIKWFWMTFLSVVLVNYQPFVNCYPSEGNVYPCVVQNSTSTAWGWWDRAQMLDLHQNTWAGNEHFLLLDSLWGRRPGRVGWC